MPEAFDPATGLVVRLEMEPPSLESGRPVRWMFTVVNRSGAARTLVFPTGQQGDVVLGDAYRWSRDRMFIQVIAERELPAGEAWSFALDDVLAVDPGAYALVATVAARPAPPAVRAAVRVV